MSMISRIFNINYYFSFSRRLNFFQVIPMLLTFSEDCIFSTLLKEYSIEFPLLLLLSQPKTFISISFTVPPLLGEILPFICKVPSALLVTVIVFEGVPELLL